MIIKNKIVIKKSNVIIGAVVAAALLIIVVCNIFLNTGDPSGIPEWDEFYELGVSKYSTGSYQSAVTALKIAIDIDNSHPEAYLLAADAYIELKQIKKAREILRIGLDATGNEAISEKYEMVLEMPDPSELLPPESDDTPEENESIYPEEDNPPEEELKNSQLTDVF